MFNPIGDGTSTETHYNAQGLAYLYTSYADTAGTQIVNQVENIYPGAAAHTRRTGGTGFRGVEEVFWAAARHGSMLGQLAFQYQAVTGAVDISTTPVVEYTYSSPANGSRITSMVYPDNISFAADIGTGPNERAESKTGTRIVD